MLMRGIKFHKGTSMLALFSVPVILILITDNVLSFIVPIEVENVVNSNFLTGLIIGFSSLVSFFSDYLFPPILRNLSWKVQFIFALIMAAFFPLISALGIIYSSIWLFIIMCFLWGMYYELLVFSEEDFVVEEESKKNYSRDWSVLMSLNVITNILGPILGSALVLMPIWNYTIILVLFVVIGLIYALAIFGFQIKNPDLNNEPIVKNSTKRNRFRLEMLREIKLWKEFLKEMSPILILTGFLNWIDMTFFVLGGIFGVALVGEGGMEWIVVVLYNLPSIAVTLYLLKHPIQKKKKLYATIALLFAGISYASIGLFVNSGLIVLIPLTFASLCIAIAWPLSRAAVSDITRRAGKYQTNVSGVYNSVGSLACFISPMVMGLIADNYGYYIMFAFMGVIGIFISIVLLAIMPKKIEIQHQQLEKLDASIKL